MATIYKGYDTYILQAVETSFGAGSVITGTDDIGIVQSFTATLNQNQMRVQNMGEGRNAVNYVNLGLDVTGTIDLQMNQPTPLRFLVGAVESGSGTQVDPLEIQEVDNIGFTGTTVPTVALEVGSEGGANDDVMTFTGVAFNGGTLTATQGEIVTLSLNWTGKQGTSSTTLETFSPSTEAPFTFVKALVKLGSDTWAEVVSYALIVENALFVYRSLGSNFILTPVYGVRRYDWTIVMKKTVDATGGVLSAIEARELFFGLASNTTSDDIAKFPSLDTLQLEISEGDNSGNQVLQVDLEQVQITSLSEPVDLLGGIVEMTMTGFGLAGLTDGAAKVPMRFFTRT